MTSTRRKTTVWIVSIGIIVVITWIIFDFVRFTDWTKNTAAPNTWHGITPGKTTYSEVVEILGHPDSEFSKNGYFVLEYSNEFFWEIVHVWFPEKDNKNVVVGVLVEVPATDKNDKSRSELKDLRQVIRIYGLPEKVTWAQIPEVRHVVWANQGVAMGVGANISSTIDGNFNIGSALFFEPMNLESYFSQVVHWPLYDLHLGGFSPENLYPLIPYRHTQDPYPEDPYDWDALLRP